MKKSFVKYLVQILKNEDNDSLQFPGNNGKFSFSLLQIPGSF